MAMGASTTMAAAGADPAPVQRLIADIQSPDDKVRGAAWQGAAPLGACAVRALAEIGAHRDFEVARAARRALWKIVRHAGRPRADRERRAVQAELVSALRTAAVPVRRELLWMLSEIGDADSIGPVARWLDDRAVREDARCTLERIPGARAARALERAWRGAPEEFRPALAHSLRVRGRNVAGSGNEKLTPTKATTVEPKAGGPPGG